MRVLMALSYYAPHCSGLTNYARRLAEGLAERGHEITVLTTQHAPALPRCEQMRGVTVVRMPAVGRISRATLAPGFIPMALRLARAHDVINLHLPLAEAGLLAPLLRRITRREVVATYHCDVRLPGVRGRRLLERSMAWASMLAALEAHCLMATSRDYAEHSPVLRRFLAKVQVAYPLFDVLQPPSQEAQEELRAALGLGRGPLIGFLGRVAAEKGLDVLLRAAPAILQALPDATIAIAGEHTALPGGSIMDRLLPLAHAAGERVRFTGFLPDEQKAAFLAACDVLVLPSTNPTEAFGIVQLEAMLVGTPVVASALPGVREPVRVTGAGLLATPGDPRSLAEAVCQVVTYRPAYAPDPAAILAHFGPEVTLDTYERCLASAAALPLPTKRTAEQARDQVTVETRP
jgi:glycosyltransferase involved in cell wall biosynthesis